MKRRNILAKPDWLKIDLPKTSEYAWMNKTIKENNLHTICTSGKCPNAAECWANGTATFMILGNICTRACKFCNVSTGKPLPPDPKEPERIARSVKIMKLKHAVITSVDRDDLSDGGAAIWVETIKQTKKLNPNTTIEVLIPDFYGDEKLINSVIEAEPEVISHNLETVRRLTPKIRSRAKYDVSLSVLQIVAKSDSTNAKSGIMLGLGEEYEEIIETIKDIANTGAKILTLGQYLQPTIKHAPVHKYVSPREFEKLKNIALTYGFKHVESSPLVRSSYHAEKHVQ
ncbi:lipoyl synthase [Marinilabiliaceae bacterium ANBcel2]|nr:lipoyl synthase [Marinilabiliaceae bacterium ANBcel2]